MFADFLIINILNISQNSKNINIINTITDDERRMILETIPKHYAGTMVLTMLCCGLRPIEIRRMKWDWIDFENAILTVGKSKTEAGTGRKIPIPPVLLDALKEHKAKGLNDEYVFVKYEKHTRIW